jgi:DNA-binding Lrp family transcriptional regulator
MLGILRGIAAARTLNVEFSAVDSVDRAILSALQDDGRLANVELAERVRLSPSATLRRVRNLEASGAIAGYHADIDPAAVGRGFQITVHATLIFRNRETIEAFEDAVRGLDEVIECQRMFGDPDYLIRVAVADAAAYEQFLINTFADLPGLARMTSQFTMKTIKPGGRLPL